MSARYRSGSGTRTGATIVRLGRLAAVGFTVAAVLVASAASAQTTGAAETLFREGIGLAQDGKYQEAVEKLEASFALDPARGTLLALAMAEERSNRLSGALAHYQDLLALAAKAGDQPRIEKARTAIMALDARVPRLTLVPTPPLPSDAEVRLDGHTLPRAAINLPIPVDPGKHLVQARTPDGASFQQEVATVEGEIRRVDIRLVRAKAEPAAATTPVALGTDQRDQVPRADASLRTAGFVTAGIGLTAIAVGGVFWALAGNDYDEAKNACPNGACSPDTMNTVDDGESKERWANIGFVAGGIGVAAGVTMLILSSQQEPPAPDPTTARLVVGPKYVGLHGGF